MRVLFADTGYWIALLNSRDRLHSIAVKLSKDIHPSHIITSEMVLVEVSADFSKRGELLRLAAIELIEELRKQPFTTVVPQTSQQFDEGMRLYRQRPDKDWSLTDCVSFLIMKERGISEALAHDKHFIQAGFVALMKEDD